MKLEENREIWINRLSDYKSSNLTQKAWSEKNGVNASALRYWIRKFDEESIIDLSNSASAGFEFASVSIAQDSASSLAIEIKDVRLSITGDYDEGLLLRLIKSLKKL